MRTIRIAQDPAADALLAGDPFALLVGMLLDQQVPMEKAFSGPRLIADRLAGRDGGASADSATGDGATGDGATGDGATGDSPTADGATGDGAERLDPALVAGADPDAFTAVMTGPPAVHRYPQSMGARVQALARVVADEHDGDAARIWTPVESGAELYRRLTALPGFGPQKAKIFVALLAKQFDVRPPGWEAAAGDYALTGFRSVADVVDGESLTRVRETKRAAKAAARAAG